MFKTGISSLHSVCFVFVIFGNLNIVSDFDIRISNFMILTRTGWNQTERSLDHDHFDLNLAEKGLM